ncbi:hypothetical protein GCK72_022779 [Caenorhabditis remanei]|uniref:F-box domain-containing protein n=1 Tax=Caenorhabditis remanei TaxID=31234 RepID=A0A6A5FUY3_CAERE|nr:hypothetical protein GCK72_022779 [Caenorhabditis remanei]KAF1746326.1 hypothetical protein GCK72_022779 [Caenorhabditis remanei]
MTFLFSLLLCWIISVFFQSIKSILIPNIPLPSPHLPPPQLFSTRQPDVPVPSFPFRLFRIPYLPLGRIIDFMDPDALISLSFCSRKSHSVIKTHRRAPFNGRLCVSGYDNNLSFRTFQNRNCVLSVSSSYAYITNKERKEMEYVRMNWMYVGVYRSNGNLVLRWYGNTTDGLEETTNYVTDLFNIDVSEVCVFKDAIKMIKWVNSIQKTPLKKMVYMDWGVISSEEMIYILRNCTTLSEICILSKSPPNFRFSKKFRNIDCLDICYGQWVTIKNLLTMDGIVINLKRSTLTNNDLNVFLKHWLSGGCPRLKLFRARTGSVDIFRVLAGLLHNAVFVEDRRDYTSPFGHKCGMDMTFDVRMV